MGISLLASLLILAGCILLVLGTLPMENKIEGNTLTVRFIIGKKTIDLTDASFFPVPDIDHKMIRVGGTSIGKKHSGNFVNTRTKAKYKLYLTGKGERKYFEIGNDKYIIDGQ